MSQETTNKAGGVSFIGLLGLVIGATIASAVFAFPGDFAAAGAGSGAVLVGWLITGIGMLGLCLAFYYLNKLKRAEGRRLQLCPRRLWFLCGI